MLWRIIFSTIYFVLVIAWSILAAVIISLWVKLVKLRRLKKRLNRKDDE